MAKKKYYSGGMIPSSMGAYANMYQGSFMKAFPKNAYMGATDYPDKLSDIDKQINGAVRQATKMKSTLKH